MSERKPDGDSKPPNLTQLLISVAANSNANSNVRISAFERAISCDPECREEVLREAIERWTVDRNADVRLAAFTKLAAMLKTAKAEQAAWLREQLLRGFKDRARRCVEFCLFALYALEKQETMAHAVDTVIERTCYSDDWFLGWFLRILQDGSPHEIEMNELARIFPETRSALGIRFLERLEARLQERSGSGPAADIAELVKRGKTLINLRQLQVRRDKSEAVRIRQIQATEVAANAAIVAETARAAAARPVPRKFKPNPPPQFSYERSDELAFASVSPAKAREISQAIAAAVTLLETGGVLQTLAALWEVGRFGPRARPVVPRLIEVLELNKEPKIRSAAAVALGKIGRGSLRAREALMSALPGATSDLRTSIVESLRELHE